LERAVVGVKADGASLVVRVSARGQVTIPAEFRRRLGLAEGDLLVMRLVEGRIEIEPPAASQMDSWRDYTQAEIGEFLLEDRIGIGELRSKREALEQLVSARLKDVPRPGELEHEIHKATAEASI
jgi:AbrB family looped-hinge helix DNA binding protein